jgi:branched-chain amino acid transport system permease protein
MKPTARTTVVTLLAALGLLTAAAFVPGQATPWAIGVVGALTAAAVASGRLRLPSTPLVRNTLLAAVGGAFVLVFSDHVGTFTDYQISQVAYFLPAVAGLNLLTGDNGQLSLGHGALMAVGAYTGAVLMTHQAHVPIVVLLAAAVAVTAAAGAVVGVAAARLRGPYLAGATLTLAVALPELATHYRSILGGGQGLVLRPLPAPGWLSATFTPERWLAWIGIVASLVTLVLVANLTQSGWGRRLRTVRDDETAAALVGINVARTRVVAFVVSAGCAGLAGALYGLTTSLANPAAFTAGLSFALLTGVVIGGLGTTEGSVWGAAALVYIPRLTNSVSDHFQLGPSIKGNVPLAIYGLVLVGAMLAFPHGIQGGVRRLARRARRG